MRVIRLRPLRGAWDPFQTVRLIQCLPEVSSRISLVGAVNRISTHATSFFSASFAKDSEREREGCGGYIRCAACARWIELQRRRDAAIESRRWRTYNESIRSANCQSIDDTGVSRGEKRRESTSAQRECVIKLSFYIRFVSWESRGGATSRALSPAFPFSSSYPSF